MIENKSNEFDMRNIRIGQYVTMACGLGYNVIDVVEGKSSVGLVLSRMDRNLDRRIKKTMTVDFNGFYVGEHEPTMYDIVRVSDEYREQIFKTRAALKDLKLDLIKELNQQTGMQSKVKTRNGYWFNVSIVNLDKDNQLLTLKMESPTTSTDPRINTYYLNGKLQNTMDAENFFSPFDIIAVNSL